MKQLRRKIFTPIKKQIQDDFEHQIWKENWKEVRVWAWRQIRGPLERQIGWEVRTQIHEELQNEKCYSPN